MAHGMRPRRDGRIRCNIICSLVGGIADGFGKVLAHGIGDAVVYTARLGFKPRSDHDRHVGEWSVGNTSGCSLSCSAELENRIEKLGGGKLAGIDCFIQPSIQVI